MTQPTQEPEPLASAGEGTRWRGLTHKELYQLLHDGPGAAASAEPARRWQEIATSLGEIGQDLRKTLEQTGARWTGRAAGHAHDRLALTASWAAETSASAARMRTAVEDQAEHLARARADMPAPEDVPAAQPDPTATAAVQVARAQTDLEAPEAAASSAEERAFEVMTAYERSTNGTVAAMASFAPPLELTLNTDVRRGGGLAVQDTHASGLAGWEHPRHEDHRPPRHHGHNWSSHTSSASAQWTAEPAAPRGAPATVQPTVGPAAPSAFTGAVLPPRRRSDGDRTNRPATGATPGNAVSATPSNTAQPRAAAPGVGLPQDMQAAAASQAAAAAHHAGAPVAPAAGTAAAGAQQDRMAMRRFGMEAIGSNQWFGDVEEPAVGQSPRRRRDFRESEEVTEAVSILDEEHRLPPNVIGDGPAGR